MANSWDEKVAGQFEKYPGKDDGALIVTEQLTLKNEAVNVRLRFTTRESDLELADAAPVLIPTTFKRYQLSQYVNSQLTLEKPVPFEFLINGSYLRTTLDEYLSENGISAENILSVEYVRARIPPQYVASYEHDDWVSSVHTSHSEAAGPQQPRILTASYDGRIRVWNTSSQVLSTSTNNNHLSFVKAAKFVSPTQIVSTGFDRTVRLWKYKESEDGFQGDLTPSMELYGHTGSVDAVDTNQKSHRFLTASADNRVGYWSTRKTDMPPADEELIPRTITKEGKRRKLNTAISVPRCGPISMMGSHTAPVTAVCFDAKEPSFAHSASFDHTIRTWDLEQARAVDTRTTSNPLFCVEQMPSMQLLAAGSAGRDLKLVDPRDSAVTVVAMTLRGHQNHVVSLARDPSNEYVLASGSHDGTCRVWDVRSTKSSKDGVVSQSIYTLPRASLKGRACPITGEGVKVFSVCWDRQIGLLSAGEDKAVQVNSSDSIT